MQTKNMFYLALVAVAALGYRVDWKTSIATIAQAAAAKADLATVEAAAVKASTAAATAVATATDAKATAVTTANALKALEAKIATAAAMPPPLTSAESENIPKRGSAADALSNLDGIIEVHRTDLHKATEAVRTTSGFARQQCSEYTDDLKTWCTNNAHTLDGAAKEHVDAHNRPTEGLEIAKIAKNSIEAERAQQLALANADAELTILVRIQQSKADEIATCSQAVDDATKARADAEKNQATAVKERDDFRVQLDVAIDGNSDGINNAMSALTKKEKSLIVASKRTFTANAEVKAKTTALIVANTAAKKATKNVADARAEKTKLDDELTLTSATADKTYMEAISFTMPRGYVKVLIG